MTIPNLPIWGVDPHTEFETNGWLTNPAVPATLNQPFWASEFAGKSNIVILPFVNRSYARGAPGNNLWANAWSYPGFTLPAMIFSPKILDKVGGNWYAADRDLGFRGAGVTHAQIKSLGLDPSQILVTQRSPYVALTSYVDYDGLYGYLRFTMANPFSGWVQMVHFDDHGPSGMNGPYRSSYKLPAPASNEIILPAYYGTRSLADIEIVIYGHDRDFVAVQVSMTVGYSNQGSPWLSGIDGIITVGSQSAELNINYDVSTSADNNVFVQFSNPPGVNSITVTSLGGKGSFVLTPHQEKVYVGMDYTKYPATPKYNIITSTTKYSTRVNYDDAFSDLCEVTTA